MMRTFQLVSLFVLVCCGLRPTAFGAETGATKTTDPVESASAAPLLQRVVLIGASVSDGFLLASEVGAPTSLSDVVEAALVAEHEPIRKSTSTMFFLSPLATGGKQVDFALSREPTLVLALDFLFWFGYGDVASEDARLELLEQGLWLVDKFDVPIVVSDFPDMSPALKGTGLFGGPMLQPTQMPRTETLARLNARLAEWAAERDKVVVVPLAAFVASIHAGEPIVLRDNRWETPGTLLNGDLLHTTLAGSAGLVVLALDRLAVARPDLAQALVRWDATEIASGAYEAKAAEREKALEKKRKREERNRAREERKREEQDG